MACGPTSTTISSISPPGSRWGTRYATNLVSQRLGNYQFHPYWGQLFDQMWVR